MGNQNGSYANKKFLLPYLSLLPASVKKVKQPTLGRAGEMKNADWAYDIKDVALERRPDKKQLLRFQI